MSHSNISIFVPHIGCPHKCAFCDQRTITGERDIPHAEDVSRICNAAIERIGSPEDTEIAFFGGSFTAVPKDYMLELLKAAQPYIGVGKFAGIRCSTRPDCIDEEILELLKKYGVTSIELGAQSLCDSTLAANERGHTAADVVNASKLIREYKFELGLQMMIGLYKSSIKDELYTCREICRIKPDTVRIYPTVILEGTRLAELYRSGEYQPFSFDTAVDIAAEAMLAFEESGIRVIKCGLHASELVEHDMVGGFYHQAFRELCEGRIYRRELERLIPSDHKGRFRIAVAKGCISKASGHKRANTEYFAGKGIYIKFTEDDKLPIYKARMAEKISV